jgi:predicted nucleic acid-binding protein
VLHLGEAGALNLLEQTGEFHVPKAVDTEIKQHNPDWGKQRPTWIIVTELHPPYNREAITWQQAGLLDGGEAEAIALARQLNAQWLLTDDAAARLFAQTLGLEVHGSLGIVLWAAAVDYLNRADAETTLNRLAQSSLWISSKVLAEARSALDQLFSTER